MAWQVASLGLLVGFVGLPHGALDHWIGRELLERDLPRSWLPAFLVIYLAVAGCVVWRLVCGCPLGPPAFSFWLLRGILESKKMTCLPLGSGSNSYRWPVGAWSSGFPPWHSLRPSRSILSQHRTEFFPRGRVNGSRHLGRQ